MDSTKRKNNDDHRFGEVILRIPDPAEIEEVKANLTDTVDIKDPNGKPIGFAGIVTPKKDEEIYQGIYNVTLKNNNIDKKCKVVASACKGHPGWTHLGNTIIQVYDVVPVKEQLTIRVSITGGEPIIFRIHIIVYF
jgi:hypothetical protein